MSIIAKKIKVHGRVHGVGFRYYTYRQALQYELTGYVRNVADGTVEILAEGPPEALAHFLSAVRRGPQMSEVTACDTQDVAAGGQYVDFQISG